MQTQNFCLPTSVSLIHNNILETQKQQAAMTELIVDFPAQARRNVGIRSKKKIVRFATVYDIQFYERPDKAHARELHYSGGDIRQFKLENMQAVQDIHMKRLSLANNGTKEDEKAVFQGCELTGIENLLTPGLMKKQAACKRGYRDAVLDEQERQDASGCFDLYGLARAGQEYSRWATKRSVKIAMMHRVASL